MITALFLVLAQTDLERFLDTLRDSGTAQRAFHQAYVAATVGEAAAFGQLRAAPGTRIGLTLTTTGFTATASPGLRIDVPWRPDVRVSRVTYDFQTARFSVSAASTFDLFGVLGRMAKRRIEAQLNAELKLRLPERLRTPGYSPNADPDLRATIEGGRAAFEGGGVSVSLRDLAAGITVRAPQDYAIPLSGSGWTAHVKVGALLGLSAETSGPVENPTLKWLSFDAGPGIEVVPPGGEWAKLFKTMTVNGVTASGDGKLSARYDLSAERVIDGVQALFAIFLVAGGRRPEAIHIEPARLQSARERVDTVLQEEIPPRLYGYSTRIFKAYAGEKAARWLEGVMAPRTGVTSALEAVGK